MRPRRVVVGNPGRDDLPSPIEVEEQALVEKLVAHAAVEGFDVAILHRLAGSDVVPFDRVLLLPGQDGALVVAGTHIATGRAAIMALRILQPIRLSVQQCVQRLLRAATNHPVEVALDPLVVNLMTSPSGLGVSSFMAAPSCCPGCV